MFRLAGVLLVLLVGYQLAAQAKIASSVITRDEEPSSCANCRSKRTMFNIAWGCLSTTIVCAWAAIHPNIPPREGPFKAALRRLELMLWAMVAPEILPCWAFNQYLGAKTVRDVYNGRKGYKKKKRGFWKRVRRWFSFDEIKEAASPAWTVAHGHFLIMGGFHLVEPPEDGSSQQTEANISMQRPGSPDYSLVGESGNDTDTERRAPEEPEPELEQGRETILTLKMLRELVKDPEFKIQITEEEIIHRSKGDALSKLILILQSTWFILQCVGRRVQRLDLTHLELTTLAMASLNGITSGLWWDKPLGAQALVHVYLKRKLTDEERQVCRSEMVSKMNRSARSYGTSAMWDLVSAPDKSGRPFFLLISPVFLPVSTFCNTIQDVMEPCAFHPDDTHVPTFYFPQHRYSEWYPVFLLITLGAVFGGIHCAGWNYFLPTHAEQISWRVGSLAVTIIPIVIYPLSSIADFIVTHHLPAFRPTVETSYGTMVYICCTGAYVIARMALLILAFVSLNNLPPTAFAAIDWARFYPHFV